MIVILAGPGVGFPNGLASAVRVAVLARGLVEQGCRVRLLCLGPSEFPNFGIHNIEVKGTRDGVEFEYTSGRTIRGRTFLEQRWLVLRGLLVGVGRVLALRRQGRVEALLLSSDKWITIPLFWLVARLCGAAYLLEQCEEPFYHTGDSRFWKVVSAVTTHTLYRLFDGSIVISEHLRRYMRVRMRRGARMLRVPILVDTRRFARRSQPAPIAGRYIAYCGTLNEQKDGVLTLVGAFAAISAEFPDLKLVLIGDTLKVSQIPMVRARAERLGVADRVVFAGAVARDELPRYLDAAAVLALARPTSRQANAGFPTKVGEYLATGNPVVVTRTGEIDTYLEDGVHLFFAPPDDAAAFADRLRHVLRHPEEAATVGRRGREAACEFFDYRANGARIRDFLETMDGRRDSPRVPG